MQQTTFIFIMYSKLTKMIYMSETRWSLADLEQSPQYHSASASVHLSCVRLSSSPGGATVWPLPRRTGIGMSAERKTVANVVGHQIHLWLAAYLSEVLIGCLPEWGADWLATWVRCWLAAYLSEVLIGCLPEWGADWLPTWVRCWLAAYLSGAASLRPWHQSWRADQVCECGTAHCRRHRCNKDPHRWSVTDNWC